MKTKNKNASLLPSDTSVKSSIDQKATDNESQTFPGYPTYPAADDIYNKGDEEKEINPENPSELKNPNGENDMRNEIVSGVGLTGNDLDVPGSELDDEQENIGNEDEENNYYSIGGDDHNDLDET